MSKVLYYKTVYCGPDKWIEKVKELEADGFEVSHVEERQGAVDIDAVKEFDI